MGKGSSESNTTSSSATTQSDERVAASDSGIAIGSGGSFTPTVNNIDNFPVEIAAFANKLIDFAGGVALTASDIVEKAIAAGEKATNAAVVASEKAVTQANASAMAGINPTQASQDSILNKIVPILLVVGGIILIYFVFKKKGK